MSETMPETVQSQPELTRARRISLLTINHHNSELVILCFLDLEV